MEKKIDIGKKANVSIVWQVNPVDYSKENEKNIKALFAKKYDISESNIVVEKQFVNRTNDLRNDKLNYENVKNITDPLFQQQLFKQYITENGIENCNFDEIVKIDSTINALLDYSLYDKGRRYTVKWLDWSNFLSYGKTNHFDFTKLHGLMLLNGEPANESGKSTFAYDLLHFLFFGETKSGKAKDLETSQFNLGALFNIYLPEETELKVEGCIEIEGSDYIIRRTLKRPAKSKKELRPATQKIEYFKINEAGELIELKDTVNLQQESTTQTNKIIKEAIGNERDFDLIISANGKDLDSLISLKNDERGKLLSRWIGLSCLEDKDIKAREMWNKKISVGRCCDQYNRETLKTEISNLEEENKNYEAENETIKNKIAESEEKIKNYNADKERYISEKKPVDNDLLKKGDVTTLETKLKTIKETGQEKAKLLEDYKKQSSEITDIEYSNEEYESLKVKRDNLVGEIADIKAKINVLKEKNKTLEQSEYCPTCHRKYDNVDNTELINENKEEIDKLIKKGVSLNNEKTSVIQSIDDIEKRRNNQIEKNKIDLKIASLETQLAQQRIEYSEVRDIIKRLQENKDAIKFNNDMDARINAINESIKVEDGIRLRLNTNLVENRSKITKNTDLISDKKSFIVKIENELEVEKNWKLYLKMVGKDGISKMVLRNSLPIINSELNRLLTGATDFEVEVRINDKGDVYFVMMRDGATINLAGASGLERTEAALALRVVLGNMSSLSKPPFILLDEVLGTIAEENLYKVKKLYDKIVNNFDFILHITHLDNILEWHTGGIITVKKENNISSIKTVANYV